ncbi:ExbD/TolR family protein [Pseudovibrio exalbescens]|uniref:ExbD/TolR family protein n=1 Tax=Pseudovibrio exalbescens TaxID=197461 RepID=UPI000C9BEEE8|nr:biopolymer transporter ExbD [Pseudovibrio exalbescens]
MQLGSTRRRSRAPSLTSLIDVIFLLLMFFMLASTFSVYQRMNVSSGAKESSSEALAPIVVMVAGDELVVIDGADVSLDEMVSVITQADTSQARPVAVLPGPKSLLQDVITVLERLSDAGFSPALVGSAQTAGSSE